jgi:hypothetical protein
MNCSEFERLLPDILDSDRTAEQESHLKFCSACSNLLSDLDAISQHARLLQGSEEPSRRVWNSLEIALRQEGLIRPPQRQLILIEGFSRRRRMSWLVPVAAALVVAFGVLRYEHKPAERRAALVASPALVAAAPVAVLAPATRRWSPASDEQLLKLVSSHSPALLASYQADLRDVNSYIRDAEQSIETNPNDAEAQQYLMDAYDQKAMVYEMALNRSLP